MTAIRSLTAADLRNIGRDSLLRFMLFYPLVLGLIMRWLVLFVTERLAGTFDLLPYYPMIVGFFGLLMIAYLGGAIAGFLLLDERDDRILTAVQVTPLTLRNYLVYRLVFPVAITLLFTPLAVWLMHLLPVPWGAMLPIVLLAALEAPIYALVLASFATNKVQGLAVMKGMGIFLSLPFIAWFVPEPWQWLLGIVPGFWPLKAFWQALAGEPYWLTLAAGLVVHLIYIAALLPRFQRAVNR